MKNRLYIFSLLVVFTFCSKSNKESKNNKPTKDSLEIYLSTINNDSLKPAQKIAFTNKAFDIVVADKTDTLRKKNLFSIANNYFNLQENQRFFETTKLIQKTAEEDTDTLNIAKSFVYYGEYYKGIKKNDSAYYYFLKAEKLYNAIKSFSNLADLLVRKADLQAIENDFFGSEKSALDALSLLRVHPNPNKTYEAYNLIGISANELNSYQKAVEYFNRALQITEELPEDVQIYYRSISLNNIGNAYQNMGNYSEAINYYNQALSQEGVQTNYIDLYAIALDNLAYSKFKTNRGDGLPDLFHKALKIHSDLGNTSKVVLANIHLSEYYMSKNDTAKAKQFSENALALSKIEKFPTDVLASLKQLSKVDPTNASNLSAEYIRINDSLQQTERKVKDRFARIQFETDEISLQKDQLAEQNRNLFHFFMGTLFIGILLFVIRTQRAKNRELLLKQAQQKANEDIYNLMIMQQNRIEESRIREKKRIAQELHDGVLGRLFGTRLNLDSLNRVKDDEAITKRNEYLTELKNIEQDIREISHDLNREKYVLINNFVAILNNLLEEQKSSFEPNVVVTIDESIKWDTIGNTLKINLYRIIQESLQNINKYANASEIALIMRKSGDALSVTISDNGVGFSVTSKKKGIGLQNMISRVQELDGTFDVKSKKSKGTTISLLLPVERTVAM